MTTKIFRFISLIILNIFVLNYLVLFAANAQVENSPPSKGVTLNVSNIGIKSATFSWQYPEGVTFKMGDYINVIVIDEGVGDKGQIPIFSIAHNMDNVNLKSVTNFDAKSLSPYTNYRVKFEFVQIDGTIHKAEKTFTTQRFEILDTGFHNVEGTTSKKNVRLLWDVSHTNIEFSDDDGIQIFMKKSSEGDFSKKPIIETKERINRADIELPNFEQVYDFKIVYKIGTKIIESDIFSVDVRANGLNFKTKDLTMNSAKLVWDFWDKEILNDNSEVQIFMKEDRSIEYEKEPLLKIKGKDELLKTKEHLVDKLKFGTKYNLKVKFIIEVIDEFGKSVPILKEEEYEFQTKNLRIKDLKIENVSNNINDKCNLTWDYEGDNIEFSVGDNLSVYVKESSAMEYSQPTIIQSHDLLSTKNMELTLPKNNTRYDIKLNLSVGERNIVEYITHVIEVPEVGFKIKEITDNSVTFNLEFNSKTKFEDGDKIQIFEKENKDEFYNVSPAKEIVHSSTQNLATFKEIKIENLAATSGRTSVKGKIFDFKINVIKDENLFQEKNYRVKMESNTLQIVDIIYKNKTEKDVEAIVEYAPHNFDFKDVESLTLLREENKSGTSQYAKYKEITSDFKNNNKFDITFDKFGVHKLKFVYKFKNRNSRPTTKPKKKSVKPTSAGVGGGNSSGGSSGTTPPTQNKSPVEREEIYSHKFNVFSFEFLDVFLNEVKFRFSFDKYYSIKPGDKVEIFAKRSDEKTFSQNPVATFEHGKKGIDLNTIGIFGISGFDYGTDYEFKAKFTARAYEKNSIDREAKAKTVDADVSNIRLEHLSDVSAVIKWDLGKNFRFGPNDVLKIFYKEENEDEFSKRPEEIIKDIHLRDGAFIYVGFIDARYDIKLVFESGKKHFEETFKLDTEVGDMEVKISEIYQTSAYLNWNYPDNYSMIDGDSISIFVKESNQLAYGDQPYYFMRQNSEEFEFLENFKGAKLSDLLPNTNYDVKVFLDFGRVGSREEEFSFKTEDIDISDLKITALKPFEFDIMWELNSDTIDFNGRYDSLDIYMKTTEEEWSEKSLLYSVSKGLNNFNKVRFVVKDSKSVYDVKLEYNLANKKISKTISTGLFYIEYSELEYTEESHGKIEVIPRYVPAINFKDGDEVFVFVSKPKTAIYEQKFTSRHSLANDLNALRNIPLRDIQQTSAIAAYVKSDVIVFPAEIIYDTRAQNSSTLKIVSELKGSKVEAELPKDYELDKNIPPVNSIGGECRYETLKDGTNVIVIDKVVPGKKYKKTVITATDVNGKKVELFLEEFTLEPTTLLEEFLRNSYYFAFDREPDEGGYNYWKGKLQEKGEVTGKYFLVNLMFGEKEFSERNLNDDDLIKVLYQIVVNRKYDSKGLSYWIAIYKQYLTKFNGDKYEAKKTIVTRMVNEPEFGRLCKQMNIKW